MARRRPLFAVKPGGTVVTPIGERTSLEVNPITQNVGVNQGVTNNASVRVGVNPRNESVGVGIGAGSGNLGAGAGVGINRQGQAGANVGVSTRSGDQSYSIGAGVNRQGQAGADVGVSTRSGDQSYSIGAGVNAEGPNVGGSVQTRQGNNTFGLGAGVTPTGFRFGPTAQFGQGQGNQVGGGVGATVGTIAGAALGGPIGAAAGSLIGSAAGSVAGGAFNPSRGHQEHQQRTGFRNRLRDINFIDREGRYRQPDGSTLDIGLDGHQGLHNFRYPDKVTDKNNRPLFSYDVDYTNDLDYISYMAGSTLSRILSGGKGKPVDQVGGQLGNQWLGSVGYNGDLNAENFSTVMGNARAGFARAGIQNKKEAQAILNQMYSEGRISEFDYAAGQQSLGLVFDGDFNLAQQLMTGRWKGIEQAGRAKNAVTDEWVAAGGRVDARGIRTGTVQGENGLMYAPFLTPDEAIVSVKPWIDYYREAVKKPEQSAISRGANIFGLGVQAATATGAIFREISNAWNGSNNESDIPNPGHNVPAGGNEMPIQIAMPTPEEQAWMDEINQEENMPYLGSEDEDLYTPEAWTAEE